MKQIIVSVADNTENIPRKGKTHVQWIITILVNITILSYGIHICWPTCVSRVLQSRDSPTGAALSTVHISWLASAPSLVAMLVIPAWAVLVDRIGRKPCLIICGVTQVIGWLFVYCATNLATLVVGRVVGGIPSGGCVYLMPMYIKEISQDDIRGVLGLVNNTSRNLGILFIYLLGGYLDYYTVIYVVLAITVAGVFATLIAPETPSFYIKMGQVEKAASTVAYLRSLTVDHQDVQAAINSIKSEDEKFKSIANVSYLAIFQQTAWRRGFLIMTVLTFLCCLSGGFSIVNYAPSILDMAHVTLNPELQSLSVPIVMIISSLLSMVFIERLGRKPILVSQFLFGVASFIALAGILIAQKGGTVVPEWAIVSLIAVPVFSYAAAVSPMPFVLMAEMFNFQIRAKIMGWLVVVAWGASFLQVLVFGPVSDAYGVEVMFIVFAVINLLGGLVVMFYVPETRGKSIENIEVELEKKIVR